MSQILIILFSLSISFAQRFNFNDRLTYPDSNWRLPGVEYPRLNYPVFHGYTGKGYIRNFSIQAMLGDTSSYYVPWEMSLFRDVLLKKVTIESLDLTKHWYRIFPADGARLIEQLRERLPLNLSYRDALLETVSLTDQYYAAKTDQDLRYWADYRISGYFKGAVVGIHSTLYQRVAEAYGDQILIHESSNQRSIDLTWYNQGVFQRPGEGYNHCNYDGAEFFSNYIAPEEITGFYSYPGWQGRWSNWGGYPKKMAYLKAEFNNEPYVLVVDMKNKECFQRGSDGRYYFCTIKQRPMCSNEPMPTIDSENESNVVPLIGVIRVCSGNNCAIPTELMNHYRVKSTKTLTQAEIEELNNIKIAKNPNPRQWQYQSVKFHSAY